MVPCIPATRVPRSVLVGLALPLFMASLTALSACDRDKKTESASPTATQGGESKEKLKIAFLLPESKTSRYESHDRPAFERRVSALCAACEVIYSNADQDASKQQNQAEAALTNGAKVLVLDPVDSASAAAIAVRARQSKVAIVSYDRLILGADIDYYLSFDNEQVGKLQARALVDKLKADGKTSGTLVVINGSPTDNNARLFKSGAHSVLDGSGFTIGAEFDTPDWSPNKAQEEMEQALTRLGKSNVAGVYAANDGTAGGAIAAMKASGVSPLPPVTGQDAELAAIQRIVAGEQFMTIYKPIRKLAESAAEIAVTLVRGGTPTALNGKTPNGKRDVPSLLLAPSIVSKDQVKSTVIGDGFWKVSQVCAGPYEASCHLAQIL